MGNPEKPRNPEKEHDMLLRMSFPFQVGSLQHKRLQGVAYFWEYESIGEMVDKLFAKKARAFMSAKGSEALARALTKEAFDEMVITQKLGAQVDEIFEDIEGDEQVKVTLPIRMGYGEHYLIEAISRDENKERDKFLVDLTVPFVTTTLKEQGEEYILGITKPKTAEDKAQIILFEDLFKARPAKKKRKK